jgi:hypothetical protein
LRHLKPALITAAIALLVVLAVTYWHSGENALTKAAKAP